MMSSSMFRTVLFPRRRRHTQIPATGTNCPGDQVATKRSLKGTKWSTTVAVIFVFFFLSTTSLNHRLRVVKFLPSPQVEESLFRDAKLVRSTVTDTARTTLNTTIYQPPRQSSKRDAIQRNGTVRNALYSSPQSIGSCHNLSWWARNPVDNSDNAIALPLDKHNKPIWVASFPGSGAEMFRQLIESLTGGQPAWSVYTKDNPIQNRTCAEANAATCKTHWPVLSFRPVVFPRLKNEADGDDRIERMGRKDSVESTAKSDPNDAHYHSQAIVLLRNPIAAYPSRFNHQWELKNKIGYHVRQGPEDSWNSWIRRSFHHQQKAFFDFVVEWTKLSLIEEGETDNKAGRVALFVPYEGLVDPRRGPMWTLRIIKVLHQAGTRHIVTDVSDEDGDGNSRLLEIDQDLETESSSNHNRKYDAIKCLWEDAIFDRPLRKRAPHTYQPRYTTEQQEQLEQMFTDLIQHIEDMTNSNGGSNNKGGATRITRAQADLLSILKTYRQSVQKNESPNSSQTPQPSKRIFPRQ